MEWLRKRMGWGIHSDDLDWENAEVHEGRSVGVIRRGSNIATYNLQLFAPDERYASAEDYQERPRESELDKRVLADLPAMLESVEELIETQLPEGYTIRITEWDK